MYLTFKSEEAAKIALEQINKNYGYPIYGVNAKTGKVDKTAQPTTAWANVDKAYKIEKWYFKKPAEDKMKGVINYAEEEYNPDWKPPVKEEG